MSEENEVLAFSVDEKLLLDKGQAIDEMLSISLDPDIAIETYHDYVQIRGIIILQGEYKKSDIKTPTENEIGMNYLEKIIDTEPGQAMFSHRFPVEISIPKNRITSMENVHVEVASFDYEIPATDCININATLHIAGITKEDVTPEPQEELPPEKEEEETTVQDKETVMEAIPTSDEASEEAPTEEVEVIEKPKRELQEEIKEEDSETSKNKLDVNDDTEVDMEVVTDTEDTIDIQLSETEEVEEEKVKDMLFLTDLFGGAEEEMKTSIKIHITQEEDTVETIAKRYDVSALQLMKENNLSPEDITEGMLVEIPQ